MTDGATPGAQSVLEIEDLHVDIPTDAGIVRAVAGVSLSVRRGEVVGIVGESGSGKTMTVMSVLRLLPRTAIVSGSVRVDGSDIFSLDASALQRVRGGKVGITFQDPATYLNPVIRVGDQVAEVIRAHATAEDPQSEAVRVLEMVRLPRAGQLGRMYPHELSGGLRQRVLLAIAIAARPMLLIADEPTTALDVTIQAQILDLLRSLQSELGLSVILVTHDLGLVAEVCERVCVMYAGRVMEISTVDEAFFSPAHPYTRGLLSSTLSVHSSQGAAAGLSGSVPDLTNPPSGCVFHPRCPMAMERCKAESPVAVSVGPRRTSWCWLATDLVERQ